MKKTAAGCFAVACIIAVVVAILASIGQMRHEKIRQQPPLTLQDLDRLPKARQNSEGPAERATAAGGGADTGAAVLEAQSRGSATPPQGDDTALPRRLERSPTDEERREQFMEGQNSRNKMIAIIGSSPVGGFMDALGVAVGIPEGALANRGECYTTRGNWAEAKSCYSEFVRKSKDPQMLAVAYARLAWLEDDPELAARYMELATTGEYEFPFPVVWNKKLAETTGSKELAEHYGKLFEERHKAYLERRSRK